MISKFKIKQRFVEGMSIKVCMINRTAKQKMLRDENVNSSLVIKCFEITIRTTQNDEKHSMLAKLNNKRESRHLFSYIF